MSKKNRSRRSGRIGRNDDCPCGSGEKYKRCCEGKDRTQRVDELASLTSFAQRWDPDVYRDAVAAMTQDDLTQVFGRDFAALFHEGGPLAELRLDPVALHEAMVSVVADTPLEEWLPAVTKRVVSTQVLHDFIAAASRCVRDPAVRHEDRVAAGVAALSCVLMGAGPDAVVSMPAIKVWVRWHVMEMLAQHEVLQQELHRLELDGDDPSLRIKRALQSLSERDEAKQLTLSAAPWLRAAAAKQAEKATDAALAMVKAGTAPAFLTWIEYLRILTLFVVDTRDASALEARLRDALDDPHFRDPIIERVMRLARDPATSAPDRSAYANLAVALGVHAAGILFHAATEIDATKLRIMDSDERTDALVRGVLTAMNRGGDVPGALDALLAHLEQIGDRAGLAAVERARERIIAIYQQVAAARGAEAGGAAAVVL